MCCACHEKDKAKTTAVRLGFRAVKCIKHELPTFFAGTHIIYIYVLSILYLMPSQMVLDLPNHREITFSEIRWINRGCFFLPNITRAAFERETLQGSP